MTNAHNVLELGTFTGFSCSAMATALPPSGRIFTCERDESKIIVAKQNFLSHPNRDQIQILEGDAIVSLQRIKNKGNESQKLSIELV